MLSGVIDLCMCDIVYRCTLQVWYVGLSITWLLIASQWCDMCVCLSVEGHVHLNGVIYVCVCQWRGMCVSMV